MRRVADKLDPCRRRQMEGSWNSLPTHPTNQIARFILALSYLNVITRAIRRWFQGKVYEFQCEHFTYCVQSQEEEEDYHRGI